MGRVVHVRNGDAREWLIRLLVGDRLAGEGAGDSRLAAALGLALIEKGWRVLFTRPPTSPRNFRSRDRDLALEAAIAKLDKCHLLILDDLAYTKDQAETSVLFELISARYERTLRRTG